jgi:uncharacterized membrane protein YkoI
MTTETKIGYESHVDKSFKDCTLSNIDEIANTLYKRFDKSEEAHSYILWKYVRTKERLLMIKSKQNKFHSPKQEKHRQKSEVIKPSDEIREIAGERLNYLCY